MGCALGASLARARLPVKDWDDDGDEGGPAFVIEVVVIGGLIAGFYILAVHEFTMRFLSWISWE